MLSQALLAFAGLGFFFAGLNMLSGVVRSFGVRQVRVALKYLSRLPFSNALAGTMLGAVTQSTSAAAYVCIGLLQSRAIAFASALGISAWSGVGTALLVFLASIDLRLAALAALALVAVLHLAAMHRHDTGRRMTELLLAVGVTLIGLAMVKDAGHESWFVLVNAPRHDESGKNGFDWRDENFKHKYANSIIDQIEARGIKIRERLDVLEIRTPLDLQESVMAPGGSIYGTSSNSASAAFLRTKNRSPIKNLFCVGGSTHPGGGLPLVGISAEIVANAIGRAR